MTKQEKSQVIAEFIVKMIHGTTKSKMNAWNKCHELSKFPLKSQEYFQHEYHHGVAVGIGEVQAWVSTEFKNKHLFSPPSIEALKIIAYNGGEIL